MLSNVLCAAAKNSVKIVVQKSPLILMSFGIGCGIASTAMAVKVTPEAHDILEKINKNDKLDKKERTKEILKNVVPLYGPAILTGMAGTGSIIASYGVQKHRLNLAYETIAGLSTAYFITNEELKDYKQSIVEKFGEEVQKEIQEESNEKKKKRHPRILANEADADLDEDIFSGEKLKERFQDYATNQVFYSTREEICRIFCNIRVNLLSETGIYGPTVSINEGFLSELPGNKTCALGDCGGWIVKYDAVEPWPKFTPMILDDGKPGTLITYDLDDEFKDLRPRFY